MFDYSKYVRIHLSFKSWISFHVRGHDFKELPSATLLLASIYRD